MKAMFNPRRAIAPLTALCASVVLFAAPASATWSIVGVDPETGDVGFFLFRRNRRRRTS